MLTKNAGIDVITDRCRRSVRRPDADALAKPLRQPWLRVSVFPPAPLGRLELLRLTEGGCAALAAAGPGPGPGRRTRAISQQSTLVAALAA